MEDIVFTVVDDLPADSLIRPIIYDVFGEITLRYDSIAGYYSSSGLPITIRVKEPSNTDMKWNGIVTMEVILIALVKKKSTPQYYGRQLKIINYMSLFSQILIKYHRGYNVMFDDVGSKFRKYPVFQILENLIVEGPKVSSIWRGITIDLTRGRLKLSCDGEVIYDSAVEYLWKTGNSLRMDFLRGVLPEIFYIGSPIERVKSANSAQVNRTTIN